MSKYILEKVKLKNILGLLHSEVNDGQLKLMLKGGIENFCDVEGTQFQGVRRSVKMSQLL